MPVGVLTKEDCRKGLVDCCGCPVCIGCCCWGKVATPFWGMLERVVWKP